MNTEIFEKARNLAEQLLNTSEGKQLQEAKYIFEGDDIAINKLNEYNRKRHELQVKMQQSKNREEYASTREELKDIVNEIKSNEAIRNLFKAEENFNRIVSSVMDIFNSTLLGEIDLSQNTGCSSGGCTGCSGGCR